MKVTKKKDLLAKIKREEAERRAERDFQEYLESDTMESICIDLFEASKVLVKSSLKYVEFKPDIHLDLYDQLEILRVRLKQQGIEVEWRDILPEYLADMYGMKEG